MSSTPQKLKYLWSAYFKDGTRLDQTPDDRHPDHDENAEWNPTAFRLVQDRLDEVTSFAIHPAEGDGSAYINMYFVDLTYGWFSVNGRIFSLEDVDEPLTERKLIFYRPVHQRAHIRKDPKTGKMQEYIEAPEVMAYAMGYEGKNLRGQVEKKVISIGAAHGSILG